MEQLTFSWQAVLAIIAIFTFIGKMWGNSKQGFMVYKTNELPFSDFRIISKDKKRTVLCEIGPKERNVLITSEAFGGKPVKPGDVVRHFQGSWKQQKELKIPNLGYPPLVVVKEEDETNSENL